MRFRFLYINAVVLSLMVFASPLNAGKVEKLPKDFKLSGLESGVIKPKNLRNKITIMQFWASWCGSCSKTMKTLHGISKGHRNVKFVSVSVDEDLESAHNYFKDLPKNLQPLKKFAYFDNDAKLATALDIEALPAYIVIDSKGNIIEADEGQPNKSQIKKLKSIIRN